MEPGLVAFYDIRQEMERVYSILLLGSLQGTRMGLKSSEVTQQLSISLSVDAQICTTLRGCKQMTIS